MNYYYDILLNWSEKDTYDFFEWNETDYLELVKKIPLVKVKHHVFLDILTNNIKVSQEFLDLIRDKTLLSGKNTINKIAYACLITDNKNILALEFSDSGEDIARSKLLIDDELNVLETSYNLKEYPLVYDLTKSINPNHILRQEKEVKRLISLEISNLYEKKDSAKLKYLYYEYKKEKIDDIEVIYENILKDLKESINEDILKLYYVIKLLIIKL